MRMMRIGFRMDDYAYLECEGEPDIEKVRMAVIEKIEAMMQAVREGGMELCDCTEVYEPYEVHPICPHCGRPLTVSSLGQYAYLCTECDEDFFSIECKEAPE